MLRSSWLTLLVEDSEDDQILLCRLLRQVSRVKLVGFVWDGLDAVSYLQGAGEFIDRRKFPCPDLLLLDNQMPRLNGMEVLAALNAAQIQTRIIFWTNAPELVDQELATRLGACLVCRKPSTVAEMNAIINRMDWLAPVSVPAPPPLPLLWPRLAAR